MNDLEIQNSDSRKAGLCASLSTGLSATLVGMDIDGNGNNSNANVAPSEKNVLTSTLRDNDALTNALCDYHLRLQQRTERCLAVLNLRSGDLRLAKGGSMTSSTD
jgi:hypothetical protein